MSERDSNWVQDLTWRAVETALAAGALALLPIGAAAKEHGLHLPHGTDYLQAVHYAERLAAARDALIWPVVSYGYYPVFTDYPGSISLKAETFATLVGEILDGIVEAGATRIAILNTGISTIAPLSTLLTSHTAGARTRLVNCYDGPAFRAAVAAHGEQAFGGHADEIETSLMLALAAPRVDMSAAVPQRVHIARGRFNRREPTAPNYSPAGVNGDPTRATPAKGAALLTALMQDLLAAVSDDVG